jgi:biotin carboxyl carrier protein
MPGLLKEVLCTEGKRVRKGETLFVLEAMKMENSIKAPVHGIVSKVSTQIGKAIEKGSVLCIIQTLDN